MRINAPSNDGLSHSPFVYREAADSPFLRELMISFGGTGYVALYGNLIPELGANRRAARCDVLARQKAGEGMLLKSEPRWNLSAAYHCNVSCDSTGNHPPSTALGTSVTKILSVLSSGNRGGQSSSVTSMPAK